MTQNTAKKRKVLILSTGGTVGMNTSHDGSLRPDDVLKDLLQWVPELKSYAEIRVEIISDVDSSYITPDHWLALARRIEKAHDTRECDGIVILHGTDTLAYTASALSFLVPGLSMPVVLTGGQRPLAVTRTDSRNNVIGATETALEGPIEVMIFFNNTAYRGNRATKTALADFHGFDSPNFSALGTAGIQWHWRSHNFWPMAKRPSIWPVLPESFPVAPLVLPWVPGFDPNDLSLLLKDRWAVILESYGSGNLPFSDAAKKAFSHFLSQGGLLFVKSQVPKGSVIQDAYAPGKAMLDLGVIGGFDMTREAMVTKLMVLKAMGFHNDKIKNMMMRSLVGELSNSANPSLHDRLK